jgi:hypothetical protein
MSKKVNVVEVTGPIHFRFSSANEDSVRGVAGELKGRGYEVLYSTVFDAPNAHRMEVACEEAVMKEALKASGVEIDQDTFEGVVLLGWLGSKNAPEKAIDCEFVINVESEPAA